MSTIINRVRSKLEGNQADVNPHEWRLPSSYSASSKAGKVTIIPDPAIFRNALIPNPSVLGGPEGCLVYPDVAHAAVHLSLIECFRNLRHSAAELGTKATKRQLPQYEIQEKPRRTPAFDGESDSEQWNLLIELAITRFETWWANIDKVFNHAMAYTHHAGNTAVFQLTKDYLPPLDVILVWYSFMLDTEEYSKACFKIGMLHLTKLCFPWPAIRDVIDTETMTLTMTNPAETLFKTLTNQSADILQYSQAPPAYSEASVLSPSINLSDLVKSQNAFFELSHNLLWIRSPSLIGTLERSCLSYLEVQVTDDLFFLSPEAVPFGIDLVWRTHRLYPTQYRSFRQETSVLEATSEISEPQNSTSSKKVAPTPPARTFCACWTCERIRDDLPSFVLANKDPSPSQSSSLTNEDRDSESLSSLSSDQLHSIQDDVGFYRAVENARRQAFALPTRPQTPKEKEAAKREKERREGAGRFP